MKILNHFKSGLLKLMLAAMAATPFAVSCYDDTGIREELDMLVDKVYELEERLNNEINALRAMMDGKAMISSIIVSPEGITTIKLSTGAEFQLYPEQDMKSFITYMPASINGENVDCWAYIDENGVKRYMRDANGDPIPVAAATPKVVEIDGETYLEMGGELYPLSGNSVFSDYELIKDELTGDVYAVTFTFGEDMSFTVTVDGACGFSFVSTSGGFGQIVIIKDYYVSYGLTEKVQIDPRGVVDYVLQVPDGWRVKEVEDVYMGTKYFAITAPSKELIQSGVAEAEGDLKVIAVLEGGKATVSRLFLTTSPFSDFGVSAGNLNAKMYNGLQKFVYGVSLKSQFEESAVFSVAEGLLEEYSYPSGYGVASENLSATVAEVLGAEPVPGEEYVFWALPALYYETADDAGYYLDEDTFVTKEFKYSSVVLEVSDIRFRDAQLKLDVKGADAYYMELVPAADFMLEDVLYGLDNALYDKITDNMTYEGSIFTLTGLEAAPATAYVVWMAIAEDGKDYSEDDLVVCEFSTLKLEAGASVKVVAGEQTATALDVTVPLTAAGAETIYYAAMTKSSANAYADDEAKVTYLFEKGKSVQGTEVVATVSEFGVKTKPSTAYVIMAVASDADGKYGEVLTLEVSTTEIAYNNLTVDIALEANDPGNVVLSVSAKDATDIIYWVGRTADNTWKSSNYLGGKLETAEAYMYLNSTNYKITSVMEQYPLVDGKITLTDLTVDVDYVIVAMAQAADGTFSHGTLFKFVPNPVALGTVITKDDPRWTAATPTVTWIREKFIPSSGMMSGQYGCTVELPAGMTGYVLLATDNVLCESDVVFDLEVEQKMIRVMTEADHRRDSDTIDPSLTPEEWQNLVWPDGSIFYHHEHGHPMFGYAVVWANRDVHAALCGGDHEGVKPGTAGGQEIEVNHVLVFNDGPVEFRQPSAIASTEEVIDKVYIVLRDLDGNTYETYEYGVPCEYFVVEQ
jgi:hypothetical protein